MQLIAGLAGALSAQTITNNKCADNKSKYRGFEVNVEDECCCAAARAIAGKRFLSKEMPVLPLDGCDASDCKCSYKLFDDRRTEIRRGSDLAPDVASQFRKQDHRISASPGRRSDD